GRPPARVRPGEGARRRLAPLLALRGRRARRDAGDGALEVLQGAGGQRFLLELEAVPGGLVAEGQLGRCGAARHPAAAGVVAQRQAVAQTALAVALLQVL